MKRKIITLSLIVAGTAMGITISQNVVAKGQSQNVNPCTSEDQNGKIVALGCTCTDGDHACTPNPCP